MSQTVYKPWGQEIILTTSDLPYTGKILKINADCRLSLQYHDQKTETFTLIHGQAVISFGPSQAELIQYHMLQYQEFTILPNVIHRISAQVDTTIVEVSTPEKGTTFRLEDDYHRPHETENIRNSPQRGWAHDQQT